LKHDRAKGRMGLVTSFQAFARIAPVVFFIGSVFSGFSILLKERLFNSKSLE